MRFVLLFLILISCTDSTEEEMKLFSASLSGLPTTPTPPGDWVLPENSVRLTLYTGQSNCPGNGYNADALPSEIDETTALQIWRKGSWANLNIASGNNYPNGSQYHSIELGLSLLQEERYSYPLYLGKWGVGGTEIQKHLKGGDVFTEFYRNVVRTSINNILQSGKRVFVDLILLQGEQDSDSWKIAEYDYYLSQWITQWQEILGANLPISFIQIYQRNDGTTTINGIFQSKADENPLIKVIQADTLPTNDGLHYSYAAHKIIAERYMDRMIGVTPLEITSELTLPSDLVKPNQMTLTSLTNVGGTYTVVAQLNGGDAVTANEDLEVVLCAYVYEKYFYRTGKLGTNPNVTINGDEITITNITRHAMFSPFLFSIHSIDEAGNRSIKSNELTFGVQP